MSEPRIGPNCVDEGNDMAVQAIDEVIKALNDPQRKGGVFLVYRLKNRDEISLIAERVVGEPNPNKIEGYKGYAREKADRLAWFHATAGHLSSWASRNPDNERYGGAIIATLGGEIFIFTFSGLPEQWDEICDLEAARATGCQTETTQIVNINNNQPTREYLAVA